MKSLITILFSLALLLGIAGNARAGTIIQRPLFFGLNNGLIGYWTFDGNGMAGLVVYDKSNTNNDGASVNKPNKTIGKIGQAMKFNGTSDEVDVSGVIGELDYSQGTMAFWMKMDSAVVNDGNNKGIFILSDTGGTSGRIGVNKDGVAGTNNDELECGYRKSGTPASIAQWVMNDLIKVSDVWMHVVCVWDKSSNTLLYVNGELVAGDTRAADASAFEAGTIGDGNACGGGTCFNNLWFTGSLDDVRLYNRALTGPEIMRLYRIGATTKISTTNTDTIQNGLIGYWTFDGRDMIASGSGGVGKNAVDRSTMGNILAPQGDTPQKVIGKIGQALDFDGANMWVESADDADNTDVDTAISVSAWIKPRSAGESTAGTIMDTNNAEVGGFKWGFTSTQRLSFAVGGSTIFTENNAVKFNKWQHVVVVYTKNRVFHYVDGKDVTASTDGGAMTASMGNPANSPISIGARADGGNNFDGVIDEVRFYGRALTEAEVRRLYNIGATAKISTTNKNTIQNGLIGHWTFDGADTSVTSAKDLTGNTDGVISGGASPAIGMIGQALNFDGTSGAINIDNTTNSLNYKEGTMTAWTNWDPSIVFDGLDHTVTGAGADDGNDGSIEIKKYAEGVDPDTIACYYHPSGGSVLSAGDSSLNKYTTGWNHLACVWDKSKVYLYYNGSVVASVNRTATASALDKGRIGAIKIGVNAVDNYFEGKIDEVRWYNRALTEEELKRLYNMGR